MAATAKSNVTIYLESSVLEELHRLARTEARSLSNYLGIVLGRHALEKASSKAFVAEARQIDISEAIARQVQAGPDDMSSGVPKKDFPLGVRRRKRKSK